MSFEDRIFTKDFWKGIFLLKLVSGFIMLTAYFPSLLFYSSCQISYYCLKYHRLNVSSSSVFTNTKIPFYLPFPWSSFSSFLKESINTTTKALLSALYFATLTTTKPPTETFSWASTEYSP